MQLFFKFLFGLAIMIAAAALAAWLAWRFMKKSENPGSLVVKWIVTAAAALFLLLFVSGLGIMAPPLAAVVGIILGIMWAPSIGAVIARPLTSFYDGGDAEVEARPFYSIARAKINRGLYPDAIAEIKKQLAQFSQDYEGWMLLAELYGDHLKNNDLAQACIEEILRHPQHAPRNLAYALNRSADWHLNLASDRDAARSSLSRLADLFPESEHAHQAAQRIAHLTTDKMIEDQKERPRIALPRQEAYIGLQQESAVRPPQAEDPAAATARLVAHLNEHPLDVEAREQLATHYAEHYSRLDLATDQIEQLILAPGASQKIIVHCLNLLADLHLRITHDKPAAVAALRRIIDLYPDTAPAAAAEKRIAYLDIELNRHKKSQVVKLGSYEQNIGLKGHVPQSPDR